MPFVCIEVLTAADLRFCCSALNFCMILSSAGILSSVGVTSENGSRPRTALDQMLRKNLARLTSKSAPPTFPLKIQTSTNSVGMRTSQQHDCVD